MSLLATLTVTISALAQAPKPLAARTPNSDAWVSRYAGWTVWSDNAGGSYVLYARHAGQTKRLPAPSSPVTQDPGAGRGPTGRPTAVYQRCSGASCEIWAVDLANGEQRRVRNLGGVRRGVRRPSFDGSPGPETHPRIWGGQIALQTAAGPPPMRLRVGPSAANRGALTTLPGRPRSDGALTQLAIGPKDVVGVWRNDSCLASCLGVYVDTIASRRQKLLDHGGGNKECFPDVTELSFKNPTFAWTVELSADSSDTICDPSSTHARYDPRTGNKTAA